MFNVETSLIGLPRLHVRRFLTVESEPPSSDCDDHDLLIH